MVLKDILAISGESGLFRFIAQGKNAIIVEHLETKARKSVYGSAKVSSLEDIAIFTDGEDMPLAKVFDLIHERENGLPAFDYKNDTGKLKEWFEQIVPGYSKDRVYTSDLKKVAQWYGILHKLNLLVKEEPESKEEKTEEAEAKTEKKAATKTKQKPKGKAPAAKNVTRKAPAASAKSPGTKNK